MAPHGDDGEQVGGRNNEHAIVVANGMQMIREGLRDLGATQINVARNGQEEVTVSFMYMSVELGERQNFELRYGTSPDDDVTSIPNLILNACLDVAERLDAVNVPQNIQEV